MPTATAVYGDGSVTLTATVTSANGAALTGGTVTFVVKQGATVRATVTSGPVVGASPATASATLPLDATWGAGNYTVVASYAGNACFTPSEGTGTLTVARRILVIRPLDRSVGFRQPNPPNDPHTDPACSAPNWCLQLAAGSSFAPGESFANLNLTNLRFVYSRNYPFSNASETVGQRYAISAYGVFGTNYGIRYQAGTLTVGP